MNTQFHVPTVLGLFFASFLFACSSDDSGLQTELNEIAAATPPTCEGVPTLCSSLTASSCAKSAGCSVSTLCTGTAKSCPMLTEAICPDQTGCYWDSLSSACQGSAESCSLVLNCASQMGCSEDSACGGMAEGCIGMTQSECTAQPGCQWGTTASDH